MEIKYYDLDDEQWWSSLGNGLLAVPWCRDCDQSWLRMTPTCPRCGGGNWNLCPVTTTGRLYTWVTVHRALDEEFIGAEPYTVGVVELEGGARIYARIIGSDFVAGEEIELEITDGVPAIPTGRTRRQVTPA